MAANPLVFLDVDTQHDFMSAEGALPVPGAEGLIPLIQKLLAYAFAHEVPVVSTMDAHSPDDPEFANFPPHCVKGTRGQLKIEGTVLGNALVVPDDPSQPPDTSLVSQARQIIIEKRTYSLFDNPHAEAVFRALGPRLVVVFGVAAEYCVRAAVLGLCSRGYRTAVVEDAVKGISPEGTEKAFSEMRRAGASTITAAELLSLPDPSALSL